ncbi:sialidase family protein [Sphingomonas solaris]|uniref:Exo-alpha-sialidase n=1 Tax=Alterirhizorhabdus solaris TaxID=2529389 RepID=A0A558R5V2_9SPHN|nr:sialidase family protein [Sphingomonas solaris]TVV74766.1 exo-alpha-sialidase [Sphingomonas solaris]
MTAATVRPRRALVRATAVLVIGAAVVTALGFVSPPPAANRAAPAPQGQPYCAPVVAHASGVPARRTTGRGCRYDTGFVDQSPSIQISRRGVMFIARSAGGVLRSTDGGRHWQSLPVPALANGDDPAKGAHGYVHLDPVTDRLYYLTSMAAKSCGTFRGGAVVSWTDNLGATWHGRPVGCGTFDWGRLITGHHPAGLNQRAVYFFGVAPRLVGGLRPVYRSLDGGATWTKMPRPASVTTEAGAGAAAPDGTIYFDYPEYIGFYPDRLLDRTYPFKPANVCRQMIAVSEDHGETWRQEAIPNSRACRSLNGQQRVAVDRAGTVYALWTDDRDSQLYLVVSRDKARSWSRPIRIIPPGATFNNGQANIIAGRAGHVVFTSLNTQAPENPRRWITNGHGDWHAYMTESRDAASAVPHFRSVDLDPPGDPALTAGESPSEAEAYLGLSGADEVWAVFSRHGGKLGQGSRIFAARIEH